MPTATPCRCVSTNARSGDPLGNASPVSEDHGSVIWRIKRGILVAREGRDSGSLRLTVAAADGAEGRCRVHVRMEVQNFYPWLRGTGPFARVGVWVYAQTQQRIHRTVTRGFLRRLATTAAEG